jgi:hypothetical protein
VITDSTFGAKVKKLSDTTWSKQLYSRQQPLSPDGKLLQLDSTSGRIIVNMSDLSVAKGPTVTINSGSRWPNTVTAGFLSAPFLYTTGGSPKSVFSKRTISSLALTTIHDFSGLGLANMEIGDAEGNLSNDDLWVVFQGSVSGAEKVVLYSMAGTGGTNSDGVGVLFPCSPRANNATVSQSGQYVGVQFATSETGLNTGTTDRGIWLFRASDFFTGANDYGRIRQMSTSGGQHWDFGYDSAGNEVAVVYKGSNLITHRLSDGTERNELTGTGAMAFGHISCRNIWQPGKVTLSCYDSTAGAGLKGNDQVGVLDLDGTGTWHPFCFSHHSNDHYNNDPMAVPSQDGKRQFFTTEWGGDNTIDNGHPFVTGLVL